MLFGRRLFGERPWQRELSLEHRVEVVDDSVQCRRHPPAHRMLDPALPSVTTRPSIALVPASVERLGDDPELDNEIIVRSIRLNLATLLLPQPDQRRFVGAHDDPCVRAADELAAV